MDDPSGKSAADTGWDPYDKIEEPDTKIEEPGSHDEPTTLSGEWSSDSACRKCGALDHFARYCLKDNPEAASARGCFRCGDESHIKEDCPELQENAEDACFSCGEPGHFKDDCPNGRKSGACFNCGEEGHNKANCPNPRVFKGECRTCGQEGHRAAMCPNKPPDFCRNCLTEGHHAKDCTSNRKFDRALIADKPPEEAWSMMKKASDEKDVEEFREAFKIYTKAVPEATYNDIEKRMREENFTIYLIALEKEPEDVITLIDLQGRLDLTYVIRFSLSNFPMRTHLRERWPADKADNIERLADAGQPYDRHVLKCRNCGELGHGSRACKQERLGTDRVEIKCNNCGEPGHRVRDCRDERKNPHECKNCGADDHHARDCPEPRNAAGVECRNCNEIGHFSKDCPQASDNGARERGPRERGPRTCRNCGAEDHIARDCPNPRDPSTMQCRNCDQTGHTSRECPEPKDWSRVKCKRCGEMGHTMRRCPQPDEDDYFADDSNEQFRLKDDFIHGEGSDPVEEISQQLDDQQW